MENWIQNQIRPTFCLAYVVVGADAREKIMTGFR